MRSIASVAIVLLLGAAPAAAQDVARGKLLYETYCGVCHYERVHDRPRSRSLIKSLADLRDVVAARAPLTKYRFTVDDIEAVVQYLNASHYGMKQ